MKLCPGSLPATLVAALASMQIASAATLIDYTFDGVATLNFNGMKWTAH